MQGPGAFPWLLPWERRQSLAAWLIRLAVGGVLCWLAFRLVDREGLRATLAGCRLVPLGHALVLFFSGTAAGSLAWMAVLRPLGYRLHLGPALRLSLIGFFLNNLIPSGLGGDVYRVFALGEMGVPRAVSAASVVAERWAGFLALIGATAVAYAAALPLLEGATTSLELAGLWAPLGRLPLDQLVGGLLVVLAVAFIVLSGAAVWAARRGGSILQRLSFGAPVACFLGSLAVYRRRPGAFAVAVCVNFWLPLLEGLAFSSIADALGLELSPLLFLAFAPLFRVLNHLPVSVSAVGTQELASVFFWSSLGATPDQALAISLWIHVLKILVSTLGVPLYLLPFSYRVERITVPPSRV